MVGPGPQRDILRGSLSTRVNAALLLTHAIAAGTGHEGPTRQDARARTLVDRLTTAPAWLGARGRGPLTTCWSRDLDRVKRQHASLELNARRAAANGGVPPKHMFGVHSWMQEYDCFCARMLANAACAVALDLGSLRFEDPPPLFSFDSTPGDSPSPRRATRPRSASWWAALASQHTRRGQVRLVHAPPAKPSGLRAGPFRVIEARGTVSRGPVRVRASHRFRAASIESRWKVTSPRRRRVVAHFPTCGARARITATRHDGTRVAPTPGGARVRLSEVAELELGSGCRVVPLRVPRGASLTAVVVARQPTDPHPGPSLRVAFSTGRTLAVRIEPSG